MSGKNQNKNNDNCKSKGGNKPATKEDCKICDERVGKNVKGIKCDMCEWWYHVKCLNMDQAIYEFHTKEDVQWVCKMCIRTRKEENEIYELVSQMIELNKMEKEKNEIERSQLLEMMRRMSDQMTGLDKKMESKINEKLKYVERDILVKVNDVVEEKLEKFKKRKNIAIYGLPEGEDKDEKQRLKCDDKNIKELIRELYIDVDKFQTIRLGRQITVGRARPIKLELEEEKDKYKFLKRAANIRRTEIVKFKKIIITEDMTFKQRELNKILREELKARRNAGERNIKIKDGRIVPSMEEEVAGNIE